jgi:hypothetical protein
MRTLIAYSVLLILTTAAIAQDPIPVGSEFEISTTVGYDGQWPHVSMGSEGQFVVVWDNQYTRVRGQRFASDGSPVGANFFVNSTLAARQVFARVAMGPTGNFTVVWQGGNHLFDGQDGSLGGVMLQRFDSDGNTIGAEFTVNSYTSGNQSSITVSAASSGEFVVVWTSPESTGPDTDASIQGQRFSSNGSPLGLEFQLNSYTTGNQVFPRIDHAPNGEFVVVWGSAGSPGDDNYEFSVVGRRFEANGAPIGSDFQVNSGTFGSQISADVAVGPAGEFMVAWGNGNASIQAQRFHSDATPQGSQFQVDSYAPSLLLRYPNISSTTDGDFLVTWSSGHFSDPGPDGSRFTVAAQLFARDDGMLVGDGRLGGEIVVNTTTALTQWRSAVSGGPDGIFTVVWRDDLSAGGNRGQRLLSPTLIFVDGFESGDVTAWSSSLP